MGRNENYNLSRLERYLSVAWESGATPVVAMTKADLCADPAGVLREAGPVAAGADLLFVSAENAASVAAVRSYLKPGVTAAFLGSSGVGKSTLVNLLTGGEPMQVSGIGREGRGRHTTTYRQMILLPQGGVVIDTPGMRELGVDAVDLSRSFADIDALAGRCRFRDCTHTAEPGCAVLRALETGELDARRLASYRKLKKEARYDGLSARGREAEKIQTMFGGKRAMKQKMDAAKRKNR